jgi:hypothetical protein
MLMTKKQKEILNKLMSLRKDAEQLKIKHKMVLSRFEQGVQNE